MRTFNYDSFQTASIPNEVKIYISLINGYNVKQQHIYKRNAGSLDNMIQAARFQSAGASNRIEGISTSDKRLRELLDERVVPHNKIEKEILGYRYCLDLIRESHENAPVTPGDILKMHMDLNRYLPAGTGGRYKSRNDLVEETIIKNTKSVHFVPTAAAETKNELEDLCTAYNRALQKGATSSLILNLQFVLDFLCIQPFKDGNGRLCRLLMLLLLYRCDYSIGKYISLESLIEKTKASYFDALHTSSLNWLEGKNDSWVFISYMLGILLSAYREFENRVS